ncbi:MAG: tetratricopeptide repeat protein [Candidatus Poribacteria bacterium]|nr:tetratricopeptide repeat protein [Candidatus Poribacteria bacterium]
MDKRVLGILGGIALVLALLSPLVLSSPKKVKRVFEAAEELFEQGQYEDAIVKYNKTLKEAEKVGVRTATIDPDFIAHVNYKIARCLKLLNRVDEALQHYRFIAVQFPDSQYATNSYVDSGDIYFDRKDYEAASEAYKQALNTIVDVELKEQIHQKYQQTLILIDPSKPTPIPDPIPLETEEIDTPNFAALTEATFLRFEQRFKDAATQYEIFADTYLPIEEAVYALYWAGRCYYEAGLLSQSVNAFQKLIDDYAYSPNAIEAYHGLAEAYYTWAERDRDNTKYQLVISTVKQVEKKYGRSDDTKVGEWIRRMQAIKQKADDKLPDPPPDDLSADDLVRQGLGHYNRGELETARRKAEQALELVPNHSGANELLSKIEEEKHYVQGLRFLDANRYNAAIVEFNKVISIDKQRKEAYFHLGVAYFNLHNYAYAENAVKNALTIDSKYEEALRLLEAIIEAAD